MTTGFEENDFDMHCRDCSKSSFALTGFKTYKLKTPKTWAVKEKSTITLLRSEITDIKATFDCTPLNPAGKPAQAAKIYINDHYLQQITFPRPGNYSFNIPANLLTYGTNRITFKWAFLRSPLETGISMDKRKYAAGISQIKFLNMPKRIRKASKITVDKLGKDPAIQIPRAGVIEYVVDLPVDALLKFRLAARGSSAPGAKLHAAVYNAPGKKITRDFTNDHIRSGKDYAIDLSRFERQTVRIVFAGDAANHPNLVIQLIDPVIYSSGEKRTPQAHRMQQTITRDAAAQDKKTNRLRRPNIIIYLVDTLRADHLSCYGYSRETTPNIDRFAKESIRFTRCFANASWTRPATASILTGLYPNKHRAETRHDRLPNEVTMLPEFLKPCGYTTIFLTTNGNAAAEINFDQGNDFYKFVDTGKDRREHFHSSERLNRVFFEMFDKHPEIADKPFFAFLHVIDPHDPYTPQAPFLRFKKEDKTREKLCFPADINLKKRQQGLSREDIEYIEALYDCEILHNDHYFGELIEFLKAKKLYENTFIIFISDHGEQFDEHGGMFHGHSIYNEEIHVPLIVKFPDGEFAGKRSELSVTQVDIVPTVLAYLGMNTPPNLDGTDIIGLMHRDDFERDIFIKEALDKTNMAGIITPRQQKHIITYGDSHFTQAIKYETYRLAADFREKTDISKGYNIVQLGQVKFSIDKMLVELGRGAYKKVRLDIKQLTPEVLQQLKALGYL